MGLTYKRKWQNWPNKLLHSLVQLPCVLEIDVMDMPYDDSSFDVALGLYLLCALRSKACVNLFKEIQRVLLPGGKAVVNCIPKFAFEKNFLSSGADRVLVEKKLSDKLMKLVAYMLSITRLNK